VFATVDRSGNLTSSSSYHSWGTAHQNSSSSPTDYGYTGQMQVGDIYYYNARWYDPMIGRFMQADTIVPSQQGTQGFDRYAYVNNNPMKYTDPSGHWFIKGWEEVQWQVQPYDENICYAIASTMAINIALETNYSYHTILDNFPIQSPKIYPPNGQKFEGYGVPASLVKNKLSNVFSDELIIEQHTFSRKKLLELLEQDVPVVMQIALRATFKDGFGHDVVAVGYDEENGFWFYNPWGDLVSESQLFEQLEENTPAGSFDEMIMYRNGILRPGQMISFKRILPQARFGTGGRRLIGPTQEVY
jgi:RHS repeat-associated protein